jgi:hypothetical protein
MARRKALSSDQLTLSGLAPPRRVRSLSDDNSRERDLFQAGAPFGVVMAERRKMTRLAKTVEPPTDGSCPQGQYAMMAKIVEARKARAEGSGG